jgi:predicted DsbA family dithiol-disulfide isomerase
VKSRLALVGAKLAEEKGLGEPYHEAMFKAHFVEDLDFSDREVLAGLAERIGLDRAEFLAALNNREYTDQVDLDIAQAQAYGLNGVPATIIANKYLISGAQRLEALQDIVRQVKAREQME